MRPLLQFKHTDKVANQCFAASTTKLSRRAAVRLAAERQPGSHQRSSPPAAAPAAVLCSSPAASREVKERAIAVTGLAFAADAAHKHLGTQPGKEPAVWEGMARLALDKHPDTPILWHTACGRAAAVVLTSQQSKSLDELGFGDIPAVLNLLRGLPILSVISMSDNLSKLTRLGDQALQQANAVDCLKIVTLATLPEARHQGLGSAIMQALLAKADSEQLPLYLETTSDEQLPYYQRFGFSSIGSFEPYPSVVMTLMLRMPASKE